MYIILHLNIYASSPDRRKATIQVLMAHSDVWNLGKDSVDLRMKAKSFSQVQHFFPECFVIVANLEAHVQEAENLMFSTRKAQVEMKMDGEV